MPPIEPHVHVIGPIHVASANAVLNESDRIGRMSIEFRGANSSEGVYLGLSSRPDNARSATNRQPTTHAKRASVTIPPRGASNRRTYIMRFDFRDVALRTLILVAGGLAAVLLVLKGQGQALPALAVGATLGAFVMARFG